MDAIMPDTLEKLRDALSLQQHLAWRDAKGQEYLYCALRSLERAIKLEADSAEPRRITKIVGDATIGE